MVMYVLASSLDSGAPSRVLAPLLKMTQKDLNNWFRYKLQKYLLINLSAEDGRCDAALFVTKVIIPLLQRSKLTMRFR